MLTRAVVLGGPVVDAAQLQFHPDTFGRRQAPAVALSDPDRGERERLLGALDRNGGNRSKTARELGLPRSSLLYKLRRLGIG